MQPADEPADPTVLYTVREDADGKMLVELTDAGMMRRLQAAAATTLAESDDLSVRERGFFLAESELDGHYRIALTEDGVRKFETALGLADDFGRHRKISTSSTIADIMDRTATREELSEINRRDRAGRLQRVRVGVLTLRYRGSEEPSTEQKSISHVAKAVVVGLVGLWTLQQFGIAVQDVQDIPGIIGHIPSDFLHLDPGRAIGDVGHKIDDAGAHVVLGAEGTVATYIVAKIVKPFARIYRKDQLVTGQRPGLRLANWVLRRIDREGGG